MLVEFASLVKKNNGPPIFRTNELNLAVRVVSRTTVNRSVDGADGLPLTSCERKLVMREYND
jgi:hypothetical protein